MISHIKSLLKYSRGMNLSGRLSMSSITVVVLTVLILGFGLIEIAKDALIRGTVELQKKNADKISALVSGYISQALNNLKLVDNLDLLNSGSLQMKRQVLENLMIYKRSIYSQISLLDDSGFERMKISQFHTYLPGEFKDLSSSPAYRTAIKGDTY